MRMLSLLAVFVDKFLCTVRFLKLYLSNLETFVALYLPTYLPIDQIGQTTFSLHPLLP